MLLKLYFLTLTILVTNPAFAQSTNSKTNETNNPFSSDSKSSLHLTGSALVTPNGINLVPTFSLNKPAAMFKFSAGNNRLSFDPEFNFSLEGKPWYFIFWLRYKLIQAKKFRVNTAGQLGLNYRELPILVNGSLSEGMMAQRYVAGELAPNFQIRKNVSIGIYFLHSHGLDPGTTNSLDFLTLNASISSIKITRAIQFKFTPQFYYLHQDDKQGTYFTAAFGLEKIGFPLSISSIINQPIHTDIVGGQNFVWNIGLVYSLDMLHSKK
jgi:hypothetical protein